MSTSDTIPEYTYTIARRLKARDLSAAQIQQKLVQDGLTEAQAAQVLRVIASEAKAKPRKLIGKIQRAYAGRSLVYGFVALIIGITIIQIMSVQGAVTWSCAMFFIGTGLMGLMRALVTFITSWI